MNNFHLEIEDFPAQPVNPSSEELIAAFAHALDSPPRILAFSARYENGGFWKIDLKVKALSYDANAMPGCFLMKAALVDNNANEVMQLIGSYNANTRTGQVREFKND